MKRVLTFWISTLSIYVFGIPFFQSNHSLEAFFCWMWVISVLVLVVTFPMLWNKIRKHDKFMKKLYIKNISRRRVD